MRQEKVWRDCERVGEQQVMLNLASGGTWSQTNSESHQHAKNWLRAQAALTSTLLALLSILIGR